MPVVNPLARELVFKLVYYGPGLGGKTTTLQHIHATSKAEHRGKMVSLATPVDRTLYFDFLPIRVPNMRGLGVRLQLFTVPGQVYYNATRKLVLTGADGVVMVFDSQRLRADANLESLDNLRENLREHGRTLGEMPHIFQYNKRDLKDIVSIERLEEKFNEHGAKSFATVATVGRGVYEALEAITRAVLADFERRIPTHDGSPPPQKLQMPEEGLAAVLKQIDQDASEPSPPPPEPVPRPQAAPGSRPPLEVASEPPPPPKAEDRVVSQPPEPLPEPPPPPRTEGRTASEPPQPVSEPPPPAPSAPPPSAPATQAESAAEAQAEAAEELDQEVLEALPAEGEQEPAVSSERDSAANAPIALTRARTSHPPASLPPTLSFDTLWPSAEQLLVRQLEEALAVGDYEGAVLRSEQLVSRSLAAAAGMLGAMAEAPRDPAIVSLLLGLDGRRYLEFRALVRDSRAGRSVEHNAALSAYAFAIEARLARLRVGV